MLKAICNLMGFSPANTESGDSTKSTEGRSMDHGSSVNLLATSVQQNKQRLAAKPTYHCTYRTQGRNEQGHPVIHCLKTNSRANPKDCGEQVAGCEG